VNVLHRHIQSHTHTHTSTHTYTYNDRCSTVVGARSESGPCTTTHLPRSSRGSEKARNVSYINCSTPSRSGPEQVCNPNVYKPFLSPHAGGLRPRKHVNSFFPPLINSSDARHWQANTTCTRERACTNALNTRTINPGCAHHWNSKKRAMLHILSGVPKPQVSQHTCHSTLSCGASGHEP
jgi:hypothetical protein